jgi:hypothetical protein
MDESSGKRRCKHPSHHDGRRIETVRCLQQWVHRQGRDVPGEFLQGMAYKLGSGAVTLLILWWEARH